MNRAFYLLFFAAALAALLASCRKAPEAGTAATTAAAETTAVPSFAARVEGTYEGDGTTPEGRTYSLEVKFMPAKQVYWVERYVGEIPMIPGVGILWNDLFVVGFRDERNKYAVIAYEVKADGSLEGTSAYQDTTKTGTEKLKKK